MNDDNDKFFAWLDGELGPAEAAEMQAKVAADPELKRLAEQHRALGSQLRSAFDPIAEARVPGRLQAALRPAAQVIDLVAARRARVLAADRGPVPAHRGTRGAARHARQRAF